MNILKCYFFKKKENLTVGDVQTILCPLKLKQSNLLQNKQNFFDKKNYPVKLLNYKLVLITKPVIKDNLLSLQVSSYVPGVFKNEKPVLNLDKHKFLLSNLNWNVKTVLQKQSKAQSYYGPLVNQSSLNALYISLSISCLLIFYFLFFLINNHKYKKIKKQEIKKYQKSISPYNEYHKNIRAISIKSDNFFNLVKNTFYIFLTRISGVAFFKYPLKRTKKEIKKNKLLSLKLSNELFFILKDLNSKPNTLDLESKHSLLNKINLIVDKIEEAL